MARRLPLLMTGALAMAGAAPLRAETLADAIATAYRTNPTLQGTRYDLRGVDESVVQAESELRPQGSVTVTGTYDRSVLGRTSASPFLPGATDKNSVAAVATLTQPLYTGGRAAADIAAAEASVRSGRETLRRGEGDLLLQVITAYVDVRRYEAAQGVWQASVSLLEKLIQEIAARREAGQLTLTDVAQADAQLDVAREQLALTQQNLEATRADYVALIGHAPADLAEEPPLPQMPGTVDTAFDLAMRESPELAEARYTELSSRAQITAARANGRPTIALRGSAQLNGQAVPYHLHDQDQDFAGQVVLTVPIIAGGRIASQVRQAEDHNASDRLKIEAARRALVRSVDNAWNAVVTAQRIYDLLTAQQKSAAIQLDGMIEEYRVGLRSTFDVLYAQQSLRDVQVSLLGASRDRYVSEATLLRQIGLLEARAVLTGVELHDPARNLASVRKINALPWDRGFRAIDAVLGSGGHQTMIRQPGIAPERPAMAPAAGAPPAADAPLSHDMSTAPIPGTVGQPESSRKPRK